MNVNATEQDMRKFVSNLTEKYILSTLRRIPGEERFGDYRYLPLFFLFGASLEYLMCNLYVGPNKANFCKHLLQSIFVMKII